MGISKHINCDGDLKVVLSGVSVLSGSGRWTLCLYVGDTFCCGLPSRYVSCGFDGTTYRNCRVLDGGDIECWFRRPNLGCGRLRYKLYVGVSDADFSPDLRSDVYPGDTGYDVGNFPSSDITPGIDFTVLYGLLYPGIRYDNAQTLSIEDQNQALENIGADLMIIDLVNGQATLTEEQEARLLSSKGVILRGTVNADKEVLTKIYFSDYQGGDQVSFWALRNNRYILQCIYTKSTKLFKFLTSASFIDPNAVSIKAQTLSATEQEQARKNIGVNNPYSPSYLVIENSLVYSGTVLIGCMAIDGDIMYFGVYGSGYFAYDYIKQYIVWKSQTRNAPSSGYNKQMVVKDEYLYVIGDSGNRIEKYNKKTGELIASRIDGATVQYGQMYISNINGNIYYHSPITKTLYLLNEEDLTANPSGIYDGAIEAIDDNWIDCICIYVSDNRIIWLDFDFQETYSVDATDVTNISSYAYKRIRCVKNKKFVIVAAGTNNGAANYAAIVQNNGANFSNSYTRNLLTTGEIFCSAVDSLRIEDSRFNVIAANGIIGGRNGLIYSDAPLSPMPFTYGSAFNIRNKLYLCYCEGSTLKLRIY